MNSYLFLGIIVLIDFLIRTTLCAVLAKFNIGKITTRYPPVKISIEPKDLKKFSKTPYILPHL